MSTTETGSTTAPWLDATALIRAQQRLDEDSVWRILDTCDTESVALVLGRLVRSAIGTQGMSLDTFLDCHDEKTRARANEPADDPTLEN